MYLCCPVPDMDAGGEAEGEAVGLLQRPQQDSGLSLAKQDS